MKIQFKRNNGITSVKPASANEGEPIWFMDQLFIGAVGSTKGGVGEAGHLVPILSDAQVTGVSELELSTTAATYLTVNGTEYKIKLPASAANHNQTISSKNGSSAAVTFGADDAVQLTSGAGISVTGDASAKTVTFAHNNSVTAGTNIGGNTAETPGYGGTFTVPYFSYDAQGHITGSGTKTVTIPASDNTDHNQTVKAGSVSFGDNDIVNFVAGSNITVTGDATAKTITIANTYSHPSAGANTGSFGPSADASPAHGGTFTVPYITVNSDGHVTAAADKTITLPAGYSHPTYTSHTATGGLSGTTLTVPIVTNDGTGHVSALSSSSVEFTHAPSATEKILTSSDLTGLVGAMVYKGTLGTGGTITTLPTASEANKGFVYVVKTAGTYDGKSCEIGDMLLSNGSSWDAVNGENQVTNAGATLSWGTPVKVATVDGTDIMVSLPANPDTNTWRSVQVNGTEQLGTAITTGALNIKDGNTISVAWDTTSPAGVKINHAKPSGASAHSSIGGVSGNTVTVPIISTDDNGHVTGLTTGSWTYTAPAAPNDGKLKVQANSGTAVNMFSADQSGDSTLKFVDGTNTTVTQSTTSGVTTVTVNSSHPTISNASAHTTASIYSFKTDGNGHVTDATAKSFSTSAATGKFEDSSNVITLTEIDGGTF